MGDDLGKFCNEGGSKKKRRTRTKKDEEYLLLRNSSYVAPRQIETAERNHVAFQSFSFIEALSAKSPIPIPAIDDSSWTLWDDETPRAAYDRDNIPVLYHIPKCIVQDFVNRYSTACVRAFNEELTLSLGKYDKDAYVFIDGELSGQLDFATAEMQAQEDRALMSQSLWDGFSPLKTFMRDTKFISHRVNKLLKVVDPNFYDALKQMRAIIDDKSVTADMFSRIDPIVMEARSLTFNQRAPLHANSEDYPLGWRVLFCFGSFTEGGYVRIPRLALRMRFLPGDALVLRGAFLEQEVEGWPEGRRICLEYYTQDSIWKHADIEL